MFLGVVALLFSINSALAPRALADALAARQEREEAQKAKTAAANMLDKAEQERAKTDMALRNAEEARAKATKLLDQAKLEQAKTIKERAALATEQAGFEATKTELDREAQRTEQAQRDAKELKKNAEDEMAMSVQLSKKADQRLQDAEALFQKAKDAINGVRTKLKAQGPETRRSAIKALAQIGDPVCAAEMCELAVADPVPEVRRDAVDALSQIQPKLHPLVVTLTSAPEGNTSAGYILALKQLSAFGSEGVPLIKHQLVALSPDIKKMAVSNLQRLLSGHNETLAKIAHDSPPALELLMDLPVSPLAVYCQQQIKGNDRFSATPSSWPSDFRRACAGSLATATAGKRQARAKIMATFLARLKSAEARDRVWSAVVLGEFGLEAKEALPDLKLLESDQSEAAEVRFAAREARRKIDPSAK